MVAMETQTRRRLSPGSYDSIMAENVKRDIGLTKPCPDCNATGAAPVRDSKGRPHAGRDLSKNCETCGGTGYVPA